MADYQPTPEQERVLAHPADRHARLLAGPGTGKSATVVALLTKLLDAVEPPRVRLLTFTRAATAELAHKVAEHPEAAVDRPSTIHSFAISVLLANPGSADFPTPLRIADDWEMRNIIEPDLAAMAGVTPTVVRRKLIPEMAANWESLEPHHRADVDEHTRNRFLGAWDQHRRVYGYTLLPELPDLLRRALESHDDLQGLEFDMLVVDEYQDLNACDLRVLRLLADKGTAVFGVGDDEQSIYSFRRAAPEGIRRFHTDYENAADYELTVSHRCGSDIIAWARHVIEGDPDRPHGRARLQPAEGAAAGETALLSFRSNVSEARGVATIVQRLVEQEGLAPADVVVLFRGDHNGIFSGPIKDALTEMGIAVDDPTWVNTVLDAPESREAMLLARLLADRGDSLAWAGMLTLQTGIGPAFFKSVYDRAVANNTSFADALLAAHAEGFPDAPAGSRARAAAGVQRVVDWLERQELPEDGPEAGWGAWLVEALRGDPVVAISDELVEILAGVDQVIEPGAGLERYLGQVQPLARDQAAARAGGVRFMSMNMSKGLTVEAAIVVAAEEGVIPRPDADIAEERRLLYVAMTRARRFHFVTWARRRTGPTARAGAPNVRERRTETRFLRNGPVRTQDGDDFLEERWGPREAA